MTEKLAGCLVMAILMFGNGLTSWLANNSLILGIVVLGLFAAVSFSIAKSNRKTVKP